MSAASGDSDRDVGDRGRVGGERFPGFGEDAPLNLSHLSPAAETGILDRFRDGTLDAFTDTAARVGYCARPVRLHGGCLTVDTTTGEVLDSFISTEAPLGMVYRPCGNRRAEVCPSCSRVYARDTFAMIRAGVVGGKTVPATVGDNPLLFVTLTAPSFGAVHSQRGATGSPINESGPGRCRPRSRAQRCRHGRPLGCHQIHADDDLRVGAPLCLECYDWPSAVVWQWSAPELWRRTTIGIRRALANRLQIPDHRLRDVASLQYAKVAEYQARGLIHFHALIRLDGPDGPGSPSPLGGEDLADLIRSAAQGTTFPAPPVDAADVIRIVGWGRQLDVRIVRAPRAVRAVENAGGALSADQVAGYLAKYATKDAGSLRGPGQTGPHLSRLASTCHQLGRRAKAHDPESPYLLLGKWAHMLGFRGHFSTKSRHYSVTLGALRRARHRYQCLAAQARRTGQALDVRDLEARLLAEDEETTLVIGAWMYQGTGWTRPGDQTLALAAAGRAREYQQWKANQRQTWRTSCSGR
jgi:hypothetical protein